MCHEGQWSDRIGKHSKLPILFMQFKLNLCVFTAQKTLKHRRVKHFGYEFSYDNNNVDKDKPLPGGENFPIKLILH